MNNRKKIRIYIIIFVIGGSFFSIYSIISKTLQPFPHHIHEKYKVGCKTCHPGINKSTQAADINLPHPDFCFNCHDKEMAKNTLFRGSKSKVEFNHKLHVIDMEMACSTCHPYLAVKNLEPGDAMPRMKVCDACHASRDKMKKCDLCHKQKPYFSHINHRDNDIPCIVCHKKISNSKSPLDNNLPEKKMCDDCHAKEFRQVVEQNDTTIPNIYFNHKLHGEDIDLKCLDCHRTIYDRYMRYGDGLPKKERCMKCHKKGRISQCDVCHNKIAGKPASHKADWNKTHKIMVNKEKKNCLDCHTYVKKCSTCHKDKKVYE